jgi:hypothetical protein
MHCHFVAVSLPDAWLQKCSVSVEGGSMNKFGRIFGAVALTLTVAGIIANLKDITRYVRIMRM